MADKFINITNAARKGGQAKLDKYGKEAFSEMGKKGAVGKVTKYGADYYKNIRAIGIKKQQQKKIEQNSPVNKLANILSGN